MLGLYVDVSLFPSHSLSMHNLQRLLTYGYFVVLRHIIYENSHFKSELALLQEVFAEPAHNIINRDISL